MEELQQETYLRHTKQNKKAIVVSHLVGRKKVEADCARLHLACSLSIVGTHRNILNTGLISRLGRLCVVMLNAASGDAILATWIRPAEGPCCNNVLLKNQG